MPDWLPFRTRVSTDIVAPAALVFEYAALPERWDEWQLVDATTTRTSAGEWSVGSTYEMAFSQGGRKQKLSCVVTEYDPPRVISYFADGPYRCDTTTTVLGSQSGVRVVIETRTGYRSLVKLALAMIGWPLSMWWVRWQMRRQVKALKRAVESATA